MSAAADELLARVAAPGLAARAPITLPAAYSEAQFTTWVIELAQRCGWRVTHFRPARTAKGYRTAVQGHVGFPDIALARDGDVLFPELKTDKGRLSADQQAWQTHLGALAVVWRPRDADHIRHRLARPAARRGAS